MRCHVRWFGQGGLPGAGMLTTSAVDLPPTADKEIPVVVTDDGRVLTANDLRGIPLQLIPPVNSELTRCALEAGFTFG